ncbi:MAG: hypothetical protein KGZ61_07295 [Sandarakinorhabdus sp.]|nr:hypothetical protein [Sandarakinorhabdus sp.]
MAEANPGAAEFTEAQLGTDPILRFFHYSHLPQHLAAVSAPFCQLADRLVREVPRNAERTVALRKLLEAKDCAVRAIVSAALKDAPASCGTAKDAPASCGTAKDAPASCGTMQ